MKLIIEDIPEAVVSNWCGGGYCTGDEIHIERSLLPPQKKLVAFHEVLEHHLSRRVKHSKFDQIAIDLIEIEAQLEDKEFPNQ